MDRLDILKELSKTNTLKVSELLEVIRTREGVKLPSDKIARWSLFRTAKEKVQFARITPYSVDWEELACSPSKIVQSALIQNELVDRALIARMLSRSPHTFQVSEAVRESISDVGAESLDSLLTCAESVLQYGLPGSVLECALTRSSSKESFFTFFTSPIFFENKDAWRADPSTVLGAVIGGRIKGIEVSDLEQTAVSQFINDIKSIQVYGNMSLQGAEMYLFLKARYPGIGLSVAEGLTTACQEYLVRLNSDDARRVLVENASSLEQGSISHLSNFPDSFPFTAGFLNKESSNTLLLMIENSTTFQWSLSVSEEVWTDAHLEALLLKMDSAEIDVPLQEVAFRMGSLSGKDSLKRQFLKFSTGAEFVHAGDLFKYGEKHWDFFCEHIQADLIWSWDWDGSWNKEREAHRYAVVALMGRGIFQNVAGESWPEGYWEEFGKELQVVSPEVRDTVLRLAPEWSGSINELVLTAEALQN